MGDSEADGPVQAHDDRITQAAATKLAEFFRERPTELFYERQLCVLFEKAYFHWITTRALRLLVQSGKLATDLETIDGLRDEDGAALVLRFYRLTSHRYWKRQAGEIARLVLRIGELGRAIGAYGEILCDAALGAARFVEAARDVREWNGRRWDRTEHDLDRVYVCDGIAYGCEIKNTLKYFPPEERRVKQEMCALMGLKPLFVVRWLPKSHMFETIKAGGFAILFETQLYPVGQEAFAREVRERLGLPVGVTATFPVDAVRRLVSLHDKELAAREL